MSLNLLKSVNNNVKEKHEKSTGIFFLIEICRQNGVVIQDGDKRAFSS